MYQIFIPFYGWITFHCIYRLHFAYPFICWSTFGLLPPFDYYKLCCNKHWYANTVSSHFQWSILKSGITGSYDNSMLNFWGTSILFFIAVVPFHILTNCSQLFQSLHILSQHLWFSIDFAFILRALGLNPFSESSPTIQVWQTIWRVLICGGTLRSMPSSKKEDWED